MNDVALFPSIEVEHVEGALQGWADRLNAVPITARQVQEGYDVYLTARVPRAHGRGEYVNLEDRTMRDEVLQGLLHIIGT